ncbi:MAG: sigma-54 dependent transcriptional regulator [Bacteroidota bacterium]|nr:sigma-54 dependent transcriptional regulator [Bacteroidota bacterium]
MDKILIIDDDENIRETLKILLEADYKVVLASNGNEGLSKFNTELPDLVVTDLKMDGPDGLEILKRVKRINKNVPVILITAFEAIQPTIDAIHFGAYDYFDKPLDIEKFKICIKRALKSKRLTERIYDIIADDIKDFEIESKFVAKTALMRQIVKKIGHVSANRVNVLIEGESGTGKELIAKLIHYSGVTRECPFVAVNCSALTESLLESELFGHVKGSFTNAYRDKKGKFELAGEGTLFLDEISEISPNIQVTLLRVLQEKEYERVGGEEIIPVKSRIIAATNRNLEELVKEGKFREDLYYRLKVFSIEIPPLRERKEAIPSLVTHFVNRINRELHKNIRKVPMEVMDVLMKYDWVGNVRELENTLYQAIVLSQGEVLERENILLKSNSDFRGIVNGPFLSLAEMERDHIKLVLEKVNGDKQQACKILGISLATLYNKISNTNN